LVDSFEGMMMHGLAIPKFVEKIQVSLKAGDNNGTLHADLYTIMIIPR
jgi:hypothetical protein